jgi:predicted regulator of Ras-like GTPase activity (Roadblock/LC7/MglB family)
MNHSDLEIIVNSSSLIEAAIQLTRDGLPLCWYCRTDASVEEIASIAAGLFSMGFELELIPHQPNAQLFIDTAHGGMVIKVLSDNTLILVLSYKNCTMQILEKAIS